VAEWTTYIRFVGVSITSRGIMIDREFELLSENFLRNRVAFISGHLDLTQEEWENFYVDKIYRASMSGHKFVVGDAKTGADAWTIDLFKMYFKLGWLSPERVTIYHMLIAPRETPHIKRSKGFTLVGGFKSDEERDASMTAASDYDIAWIRPGRENSGTAKNIERRKLKD
jgi:hypothetical protein